MNKLMQIKIHEKCDQLEHLSMLQDVSDVSWWCFVTQCCWQKQQKDTLETFAVLVTGNLVPVTFHNYFSIYSVKYGWSDNDWVSNLQPQVGYTQMSVK